MLTVLGYFYTKAHANFPIFCTVAYYFRFNKFKSNCKLSLKNRQNKDLNDNGSLMQLLEHSAILLTYSVLKTNFWYFFEWHNSKTKKNSNPRLILKFSCTSLVSGGKTFECPKQWISHIKEAIDLWTWACKQAPTDSLNQKTNTLRPLNISRLNPHTPSSLYSSLWAQIRTDRMSGHPHKMPFIFV